jgi:hypothetical protein
MLIKLHGSVNWAREILTGIDNVHLDRRSLSREVIRQSSSLDISRNFVMIGEYPPAARHNKALFPALAIPVEEKLDFECPSEHVDALTDSLPYVRRILIIGWRATERPFLQLLKQKLQKQLRIMIVAGDKSKATTTAKNLQSAGIVGPYDLNSGGFTDFILNRSIDGLFT